MKLSWNSWASFICPEQSAACNHNSAEPFTMWLFWWCKEGKIRRGLDFSARSAHTHPIHCHDFKSYYLPLFRTTIIHLFIASTCNSLKMSHILFTFLIYYQMFFLGESLQFYSLSYFILYAHYTTPQIFCCEFLSC